MNQQEYLVLVIFILGMVSHGPFQCDERVFGTDKDLDIFDHGQSSISQMYRNLHIQHHLVQEDDKWDIKPNIPGLTAKGFETWQTLMILAHPDEEFERLRIAALNMPINNPDDKKERFPKEIPRRLFPKRERFDIRDDLIDAMETYANVNIPRNDKTPAPRNEVPQRDSLPTPRAGKSSRRRCSDAASHESFTDGSNNSEMPFLPAGIERERKPYSRVPAESAIADTTPMSATPIERERKPYSAAPGGGKVHEDLPYNTLQGSVSSLPPINSGTPGLHRSTSNASRPINIPPPPPNGPRMDKMSASEYASPLHNPRQIPYLKDSMGSRRRNHSPQSNNMRRSDTDIRGFQSSSYDPPGYMSRDVFPPPPPPHPVSNPYVPSEPRYEDDRRYGRESDLRRENYVRGGSPNRRNAEPVIHDRRGNVADEEYYRRRDNPLPPPPPPRNW